MTFYGENKKISLHTLYTSNHTGKYLNLTYNRSCWHAYLLVLPI